MINPLNTGASAAFKMYSAEQIDYIDRKLKHYNEWLIDNKRSFTEVYPGFPEDEALLDQIRKQGVDHGFGYVP